MKETVAQKALGALMAAAWIMDHEAKSQAPQVKSIFRTGRDTAAHPEGF